MFLWGAAIVLIASFAGLALLWQRPILQEVRGRPVLPRVSAVVTHPAVTALCGAVGVTLLGVCLWSAFWSTWPSEHNFAMTFVFVIFWVGLVPASVILGDIYRAFNPWLAIGRVVGLLAKRALGPDSEPLAYPQRLGYWPAALGLLAFGWLELVRPATPTIVGIGTLIYGAAQLVGMGLYGTETWSRRGDAFSVYFNLFGRIGPWARDGRRLVLRRPLTGLADWPLHSGAVALLAVIIGTVTFDGLSQGDVWQTILEPIQSFWESLGVGDSDSLEFVAGTGLLGCILVVGGFYFLGTLGARSVGGGFSAADLRRRFLHTLAPIALAYAGAHYFSLLVYSGQGIYSAASDPLGRGWDLFGTASTGVSYSVIDTNGIWWTQLALVLVGHILALALAHDRALAMYADAKLAIRSQYWMLVVMIGYTTLALWLLHTADTSF